MDKNVPHIVNELCSDKINLAIYIFRIPIFTFLRICFIIEVLKAIKVFQNTSGIRPFLLIFKYQNNEISRTFSHKIENRYMIQHFHCIMLSGNIEYHSPFHIYTSWYILLWSVLSQMQSAVVSRWVYLPQRTPNYHQSR